MRIVCPIYTALALLGVGCQRETPPSVAVAAEPPAEIGRSFCPAETGTIRGQVGWEGGVPEVPAFVVPPLQFGLAGPHDRLTWPNPHAPRVDSTTRGVGNAVVYLRGIDPAKSRPWDWPAVEIDMRDFQFAVRQGTSVGNIGFVRRGDGVTMISRDATFHAVHADGAAFFSIPFADADQPVTRRLPRTGLVELRSAANYFWMRAYVFVADHSYYCRTDAAGHFELTNVPAGTYEVVCWIPHWVEAKRHRDPESAIVLRHFFRSPLEVIRGITVTGGQERDVSFTVAADRFTAPARDGQRQAIRP